KLSTGELAYGDVWFAARTAIDVPRITGSTVEPDVAVSELAGRELGHEHGAGLAQPLDGSRINRRNVVLVWPGTPRRSDSLRREQVLDAVRDAVKRSLVAAGPNVAIGLCRLVAREIFRE